MHDFCNMLLWNSYIIFIYPEQNNENIQKHRKANRKKSSKSELSIRALPFLTLPSVSVYNFPYKKHLVLTWAFCVSSFKYIFMLRTVCGTKNTVNYFKVNHIKTQLCSFDLFMLDIFKVNKEQCLKVRRRQSCRPAGLSLRLCSVSSKIVNLEVKP